MLGFSQNIAHLRWSQIDRHQNEIPWNRGRHIAPCIAPETLHCSRAARLVARGPRGCSQSSRIAGVSGADGGRINPNGRLGSRHARARLPPTGADLGGRRLLANRLGPLVSDGPAGANRTDGLPRRPVARQTGGHRLN